jgi:hypothetical protein
MDRRTAGLKLKSVLQRHRDEEAARLEALPENAPPDETFAAIEAASTLTVEGLELEVRRRRRIEPCPVPGCRYAGLRAACSFSNVRFEIRHPASGRSAAGSGLLWHLMADHGPSETVAPEETALLALFGAIDAGPDG